MSVYKYISLSRLRREGIEVSDLSDEDAVDLIIRVSEMLNGLLEQRFVPLRETLLLDGRGSPLLLLPHPVLEIESVEVGAGKTPGWDTPAGAEPIEGQDFEVPTFPRRVAYLTGSLEPDAYVVEQFLLEATGILPEGLKNVSILGYFGWQSDVRKVETVTTSDLVLNATEVEVASVEGFRRGRMVVFEKDGVVEHSVILTDLEAGPPAKLKFDKATDLEVDLAAGVKAISFGRVPRGIADACTMLAIQNRFPMASDEAQDELFQRLLSSEKTDNYSYKLVRQGERGGTTGAGSDITGDPLLDALLSAFSRPSYIGLV